jgi:hypothetical protein
MTNQSNLSRAYVFTNNSTVGTLTDGSLNWTIGTRQKSAFGYETNNCGLSTGGISTYVDSSVYLPIVNQIRIGFRANGGDFWNGYLSKIAYYPARLTNAEIVALTEA